MAVRKNFYDVSDYGDTLKPADRIKIEHHIYISDENTDISKLTPLSPERLQTMREESAAAEQAIFEKLRESTAEWEEQAAQTLLLDKAIAYVRTPPVKHTANQWTQNENNRDHHSISNMVYAMSYNLYERRSYGYTGKDAPLVWELTWSVYTNAPNSPYNQRGQKIAGQERKVYSDKADMEKYLAGRIKAYSHLFTEISPPVPQGYANSFRVNGQLLPGYTVEGEEPKQPERAADIGGDFVTENTEPRKEHEDMNEPLNIQLTTRELNERGEGGAWLKLPATAEQLTAALARIGAQNGDFFINGIESPVAAVERVPLESIKQAGIDELNYLAAALQSRDERQTQKLNAAAEIANVDSVHRLAELTQNTGVYDFHPDIFNHAQLGEHTLEHSGLIQIPDEWAAAIDIEKLGHLAAEHEKGRFTEHGYIVPNGEEWKPVAEIPQEYRIAPAIEMPEIDFDAAAATATRAPAVAAVPFVLVADNPRERMKEITDKLEAGIQGIFDSEQYKTYLQTLAKFHNYSFNNCLLIAMQKPDASHVAGFNAWRDDFKRQVRKGEKGIKIIAPSPFKAKKMVDAVDQGGKPLFDRNGQRVKMEQEITVPAFKVTTVFDVSQTDGDPLPEIGISELAGSVDKYKEFFAALEKASPVPVGFETIPSGAKGFYEQTGKRIAINEGMSELQNLKTLIHEIAHARLHDIDKNAPKDTPRPDRNTREVEAESIAYTVCAHYGLDTSDYSFGYVAGWSGDKQLDALKASLDTIRKEADAIITEVDKSLAELEKEQTIAQTEQQPGHERWSEPATPENAPDNPGVPSDDVNKYLLKDAEQGDTFTIYQLKDGDGTRDFRFQPLEKLNAAPDIANYDKTYTAPLDSNATLDKIYFTFNMDRPEDFKGHSLSVSDVVVMNKDGKETAFYVDGKGFQELSAFLAPKEQTREQPAQAVNLPVVAAYMQKLYDAMQAVKPGSNMSVGAYNATIKRLEQSNERIPGEHPQLKALITHAAQSPDFNELKKRMETLKTEFIQHYSTAVQMTLDTSGKAEPPAPAASVPAAPAQKATTYGENVAAIENRVKAGETINLSDLSDAMKKDKQAAQTQPSTAQRQTRQESRKPAQTRQPSIKEKLAANKQQIEAKKSAPQRSAAHSKNAELGG